MSITKPDCRSSDCPKTTKGPAVRGLMLSVAKGRHYAIASSPSMACSSILS